MVSMVENTNYTFIRNIGQEREVICTNEIEGGKERERTSSKPYVAPPLFVGIKLTPLRTNDSYEER